MWALSTWTTPTRSDAASGPRGHRAATLGEMHRTRRTTLVLALGGALAAASWSATPPPLGDASEALRVRVLELKTAPGDGRTAAARWVVALTEVTQVHRSAGGLEVGETFTIRYLYDPPPPGKGAPLTPMLVRGALYEARLEPSDAGLFVPATPTGSLARVAPEAPAPASPRAPAAPSSPAPPTGPPPVLPLAVGVLLVSVFYGQIIERIDTIPKRGIDP